VIHPRYEDDPARSWRWPERLNDHVGNLQRSALPGEVFGHLGCALVTALIQRIIGEDRCDGGGELILIVPGDAGSRRCRVVPGS
jgi:hypothetical protein